MKKGPLVPQRCSERKMSNVHYCRAIVTINLLFNLTENKTEQNKIK